MLCVVVAVLILVLFLMKRFSKIRGVSGCGDLINILGTHYVTPKQRIALVDIAGEKIVIGITQDKISFLTKIKGREALERIENGKARGGGCGLFSNLLKSAIKGKGGSG